MYKKILVPLDGSEVAECVLPHVKNLAQSCQAGGIMFVRVVEPFPLPRSSAFSMTAEMEEQIEEEHKTEARNYLKKVLERMKKDGVEARSAVLEGSPADQLIEYSRKGVDLIVMATHGRSGVRRWVWGSVADRVLRHTEVPVLMVRATEACAA